MNLTEKSKKRFSNRKEKKTICALVTVVTAVIAQSESAVTAVVWSSLREAFSQPQEGTWNNSKRRKPPVEPDFIYSQLTRSYKRKEQRTYKHKNMDIEK